MPEIMVPTTPEERSVWLVRHADAIREEYPDMSWYTAVKLAERGLANITQ